MKKQIQTSKAPAAIGPYSQAIEAGDFIFGSGQIGINPQTGEIVTTSIEAETTRVMNNIHAILQAAGLQFDNVVKCSVFVKRMSDYDKINKIYNDFFDAVEFPPARELVEVSRLPKDVNIEISFIAVRA